MNDMLEILKQPVEKTPRSPEREIVSSMNEIADTISRFSVDPTELPTRPLVIGNPEEIAKVLGDVEVVDPSLLELVGGLESDNEIFYGTVITAGEARSLAQVVDKPADKRELNKFADKILDTTSKVLAGVGGKKALTVSLLPVLAVSCSKTDVPPTIDVQPTPESVATEQITVEEPTPIPPEPTPFPTVPPESFSNNKQALIREGYRIVEEDVGWKIVDKDRENMVATAVSEEKIAINVNGETKEFSQEAFVPMILNGDTVYLLTIQENGENVDYFYIKETGEWVTPIEVQTVPDNPENYTQIELEDVWSGRLLYSEMLVAEDFPEGTAVHAGYFGQAIGTGDGEGWVFMGGYVDGEDYYQVVNENNDPQRLMGFYKLQYGDKDMYIATQQMLNPDGKTSAFFHYGFSDYWITARSNKGGLQLVDLILASEGYGVGAVVYITSPGKCAELATTRSGAQPANCDLYENEKNDPLLIIPSSLMSEIEAKFASPTGRFEYFGIPQEVAVKLQRMIITPRYYPFPPQYFQTGE